MKQLKILSLGDDSVRTTQNYLPKIAKCESVEIISGTAFKQDATLLSHTQALKNNTGDYCFVCNKEGSVRFDTVENCSLAEVLDWFSWDYVVLQQNITLAGAKDSYVPYIAELEKMIKELCPSAAVALNEPYVNGVREACVNAVKNSNIKIILPVSEVWEAAEEAGIHPTSDSISLSSRENDFLTAGVWFEVFTGTDMSRSGYRLPFVESEVTAVIKNAVHSVAGRYVL